MKKIYIFCILFFVNQIFAQEFKIEKIQKSDFAEKFYKPDSTAAAVVDYEIGKISFETRGDKLMLVTTSKKRIKIFNSEGFDYATVKIPLYRDQSTKETVDISDAYTFNLVNDEIEKTKLNSSGQFLEKQSENHSLFTFTMPNVKTGSIIEFTIKITSPFFTYIPDWNFQYSIPVKYSEVSFKIPKELVFYKYIRGNQKINQTTSVDSFVYKTKDVPALVEEKFVTNINNFRSTIIHSFSGHMNENGLMKMVGGSWEDIVKNINEKRNFGAHLKKDNFEKEFVSTIIEGKTATEEKAQAVFEYVRDNFSWNEKKGIEVDRSLKEIFNSKTGNSAEINILTIALMRSAGVPANPILLATRNKGIQYIPNYEAFDNVIIGVEDKGKTLFFDPTNKYSNMNILPIHNLNWIGRMIKSDGNSKDVLLEPQIESVQNVNAHLNLDVKNGSIYGFIRKNLSNYEAFLYRNNYKNLSNPKILDNISEKYKIQIDSLAINNFNNANFNIEEFISIKKENSFDLIGDKIYITPTFIFVNKENPFKLNERSYPIDFLYPNKNNYTITYSIPEGYAVEYLPKSQKIDLASGLVSAKWTFIKDEKKFQVRWSVNYNSAYIDAKEYLDIKQFFEELIKFMDEKIVLKKI